MSTLFKIMLRDPEILFMHEATDLEVYLVETDCCYIQPEELFSSNP